MDTVDRRSSVSAGAVAPPPVSSWGTQAALDRRVLLGGGVLSRVLVLYGLVSLVSNAAYLAGYYLLPEGWLRGSPSTAAGRAASTGSFWSEFGMTLLFNVGIMVTLIVVCNLTRVRGIPVVYLLAVSIAATSGLISGSNSFVASDLTQYNAREGTALALGIGGLEGLGFVLVAVATLPLGIFEYRSWWRWWGGKYKAVRTGRLREVRFTRAELVCLGLALTLLLVAAWRETTMALGT